VKIPAADLHFVMALAMRACCVFLGMILGMFFAMHIRHEFRHDFGGYGRRRAWRLPILAELAWAFRAMTPRVLTN